MKNKRFTGVLVAGLVGCVLGFACGRLTAPEAEAKVVQEHAAPTRRAGTARPVPARVSPKPRLAETDEVVVRTKIGEQEEVARTLGHSAPARPARVKDVVTHDEAMAFVSKELADMWGEDAKRTAEGLRRLGALGRSTLLECLRERMRLGTAQERVGAVLSLGALFGEESGKMKKMVDDGKGSFAPAEDGDEGNFVSDHDMSEGLSDEERAARQTKELVKALADGLSDSDNDVRSAAYDAMRALAREEAGILEGQIFSGNDAELKMALLADAAEAKGEAGVMTSIAGLENSDANVAAAAAKNLKAITGQDFKTEQQALDWWEAHGAGQTSQEEVVK